MKLGGQHSRSTRKGGSSRHVLWQTQSLTRDLSPRQLPTEHDHDGEPQARPANISVINRRVSYLEYCPSFHNRRQPSKN